MGESILFFCLGVSVLVAAYCIGRVDGYWKRAEEELRDWKRAEEERRSQAQKEQSDGK